MAKVNANWSDIMATIQLYQSAALRNDRVKADELRAQAHDLLDVALDLQDTLGHVALGRV